MPKFTELHEWRWNPGDGDIDMRFKDAKGNVYDASFAREMVPALLVRLHQMLSSTMDEYPAGFKELAEAYIPKSVSVIHLPNGDQALEIVTQTEMRVPVPLLGNVSEQIRAALADALLVQVPSDQDLKH